MKLNRATVYALEALTYLAALAEGRTVPSHEAARAWGIPEKFLLKVLQPLARARLLNSLRGPGGGYRLGKPAKDITVLEVLEAVEGPVRGEAPDTADRELQKRLQALCDQLAEMTRAKLGKVRLSDLVGGKRKG
jgi:Rrf2 family protein